MSTGQEESEESQFVDLHYPGPIHIADSLKGTDTFRTVIELNTDQQVIYRFNGLDSPDVPETRSSGFYERAEPYIDRMAHLLFIAEWNEMTRACDDTIDSINNEDDPRYKLAKKIKGKCKDALDRGPSKHEIEEVKGIIRRTSQIDREKMNPDTHIPFKNGNLNLSTWQLESASPELFFTYQIAGNYTKKLYTLNDTPVFRDFLFDLVEPRYIPTVLDYMSYTLFPGFPAHKILVIVGPPRVGKGTLIRLNQTILNDAGVMIINLSKFLIPDNRFTLQGIQGKNLLIDPEIKRDIKSSADFHNINTLFGGDTLQVEEKGRTPFNYRSKAKGVLAGNIPLFYVDNAAFLARLLIVPTKNRVERTPVPDLEKRIFEREGENVVNMLLHILHSLIKRNFRFSGQLSDDQYARLWEYLADPVSIFVDEHFMPDENGGYVKVDESYDPFFKLFCAERGIPMVKKQTYTYKVGKQYPKRKIRDETSRLIYAFTGCRLSLKVNVESKETSARTQRMFDDAESNNLESSGLDRSDLSKDDENRKAFGL